MKITFNIQHSTYLSCNGHRISDIAEQIVKTSSPIFSGNSQTQRKKMNCRALSAVGNYNLDIVQMIEYHFLQFCWKAL